MALVLGAQWDRMGSLGRRLASWAPWLPMAQARGPCRAKGSGLLARKAKAWPRTSRSGRSERRGKSVGIGMAVCERASA